ncbi:Peroxisome biogenesis protein 16 [Acorus calamus]|uniref:Peroxisomal membrane protein PEX16 n=1 Tax=Acorus calamus TaxID=4465 RepID=A0AAV9FDJ3_ACOCL|nr:Peroxisome biogenesis protein 16 [Acorus calamus]
MEAYRKWVWKNREFVQSLESLLNGLTWMLPERFSDSEIGPEAVSSLLGIISSMNQHIIDADSTQKRTGVTPESLLSWSFFISALKELETLVEVVVEQFYGDDKKWNFIAAMEGIKVMMRLALFRDSGYKMLLQGGASLNVEESVDAKPGGYNMPRSDFRGFHTRNLEGRAMFALNRFGENAKINSDPAWLKRLQHGRPSITKSPALMAPKPTLSTILSQDSYLGALYVMGEVLHVIRPFVYVLFIRKYGLRSWVPWSVSLAVELSGVGVLSQATKPHHSGSNAFFQLSAAEKHEVRRRKMLWALYLVRDPCFTKYVRHRLEKTGKAIGPVPVVGFLTAKVIELLIGAQTRYTYISGS